jgi:hypothetical protein
LWAPKNGNPGLEMHFLPEEEVIEVTAPDLPTILIPRDAVLYMEVEQELKQPATGPQLLVEAQEELLSQPVEVPKLPEGARTSASAPLPQPKVEFGIDNKGQPMGMSKPKLSQKLDSKFKKKRGRPKKVKKDETD